MIRSPHVRACAGNGFAASGWEVGPAVDIVVLLAINGNSTSPIRHSFFHENLV